MTNKKDNRLEIVVNGPGYKGTSSYKRAIAIITDDSWSKEEWLKHYKEMLDRLYKHEIDRSNKVESFLA